MGWRYRKDGMARGCGRSVPLFYGLLVLRYICITIHRRSKSSGFQYVLVKRSGLRLASLKLGYL